MKKNRLIFLLCSTLVLFSCGDSIDGNKLKSEKHKYRVVYEATGIDYSASTSVTILNTSNTNNVTLYDETENKDLKQMTVNEGFEGKKIYYTTDKVQIFSAAGYISSDSGAVLSMTVYEDGEEVYNNTASVPDGVNTAKTLQYYTDNIIE